MAVAKSRRLTQEQVQAIARALADPRRYEIVRRLGADADVVTCGRLLGCVGVSAATLSHHLKELEEAGLVKVTRDGKYRNYTLRRDVLTAYLEHMANI